MSGPARAVAMSPQEEETLVLAAIARLGEASAHDIATELGVMTVRHTLRRLVDARRVEKRRLKRPQGDVWVFRQPAAKHGLCKACGRPKPPRQPMHTDTWFCDACFFDAHIGRAAVTP